MIPWFIWKGKNSDAMGLWISKLPKLTKPTERYETIDIPGRSGSLLMLEGSDVYEGYVKECVVQTTTHNPLLPQIINWLRGESELLFSNENMNRVYYGRILDEVSFERVSNDILQATIPFYVEPFKRSRFSNEDIITFTQTGTIYNPGDVQSRPYVRIEYTGELTVETGIVNTCKYTMHFLSIPGEITVDCEAGIITSGGDLWQGDWEGDFLQIPVGSGYLSMGHQATVIVDPRWRWLL